MSFKKDGETKVYRSKDGKTKTASEKEEDRYTVDQLVKESELEEEKPTDQKK